MAFQPRSLRPLLAGALLSLLAPSNSTAEGLPYEQRKDLVYGESHGVGLLMDVFTPRDKTNGLAIIDVVSGAWSSDRSKIRDHTLAQIFSIYCAKGYTVFGIRPGSKDRFTAADMEKHLRVGIRFVKEHAEEYHIDPERLGMTGASAGGHLALLEALNADAARPDPTKDAARPNSRVRAVGVFFPPTDLLEWEVGKPADPEIVGQLLFPGGVAGHSADELAKRAREASPLHRVSGKPSIPFLLIHGDADPLVPLSHSQRIVEAIHKAGGTAELIVKPGGGHPWLTLAEEVRVMADWFDKQLANAPK